MADENPAFKAARSAYQQNAKMAEDAAYKTVSRLHDVASERARGASGSYSRAVSSEFEALVREVWPQMVERYGYTAAQVALEQYASTRNLYTGSDLPSYDPEIDPEAISSHAEALASADLVGEGFDDPGKTARSLSAKLVSDSYSVADRQLQTWARADPARPRWALVPSAGACGWCRLMGSRGFVYASSRTLEPARHPSCRCTPTVSFSKSPRLDAYDPGELQAEYRAALGSSEGTGKELTKDVVRNMNDSSGYWKQKYAKRKARDAQA